MNEEAALLQAMLAEPHNSALQLIAADWLEERGDARGELLRLAQELTNAIKIRNRAEKERRVQALLADGVRPFVPIVENSISMKLALLPSGTFLSGSPRTEPERSGDEMRRPWPESR
jgi:uncharacterized protein (TIGR02996 family)